jgi:hypothetical protein
MPAIKTTLFIPPDFAGATFDGREAMLVTSQLGILPGELADALSGVTGTPLLLTPWITVPLGLRFGITVTFPSRAFPARACRWPGQAAELLRRFQRP